MVITQESIFQLKRQLQLEIEQYEKQLQEVQEKQKTAKKIDELAQLFLQYEDVQNQISDRAHVFALLSEPMESVRRPMVKAQFFTYIEAAETISLDLVNFLTELFLQQIRIVIQAGEDDTVQLVQNEFKEYIIPGKIIAEQFTEIDDLLDEMNRHCKMVDQQYDEAGAQEVLRYAFQISLDADTKMPPTIQALREHPFRFLTDENRASLLDAVQERLAILQYDQARKQQIAMDKALNSISEREEKEGN